jgi:RHS repeat-associated protein
VLASVLGDGLATYTPGISERRGGESRFFHAGIKSFDAQTDELGAVAATRRYDGFGNTLAGGWTSPFAHGGPWGYQTDANGLQLLGHRYYDPTLGRFLTRDPAEDGRNHHTYCWNNPVSGVDPDGLSRLTMQGKINFYRALQQGDYETVELLLELSVGQEIPDDVKKILGGLSIKHINARHIGRVARLTDRIVEHIHKVIDYPTSRDRNKWLVEIRAFADGANNKLGRKGRRE